ncbi:hypothetical protein SKAU_G00028460 [Synaphobranchus kaupii]|uniref:Uncharacterized protein n=1 Tax=Synaphobranchus kaupii TaxID=118154 RepID=A0A9Q1GEF5_SYNKA|nr:hypothetical protein SKAU_G00028460 [Synaphobranchus kaupii]
MTSLGWQARRCAIHTAALSSGPGPAQWCWLLSRLGTTHRFLCPTVPLAQSSHLQVLSACSSLRRRPSHRTSGLSLPLSLFLSAGVVVGDNLFIRRCPPAAGVCASGPKLGLETAKVLPGTRYVTPLAALPLFTTACHIMCLRSRLHLYCAHRGSRAGTLAAVWPGGCFGRDI